MPSSARDTSSVRSISCGRAASRSRWSRHHACARLRCHQYVFSSPTTRRASRYSRVRGDAVWAWRTSLAASAPGPGSGGSPNMCHTDCAYSAALTRALITCRRTATLSVVVCASCGASGWDALNSTRTKKGSLMWSTRTRQERPAARGAYARSGPCVQRHGCSLPILAEAAGGWQADLAASPVYRCWQPVPPPQAPAGDREGPELPLPPPLLAPCHPPPQPARAASSSRRPGRRGGVGCCRRDDACSSRGPGRMCAHPDPRHAHAPGRVMTARTAETSPPAGEGSGRRLRACPWTSGTEVVRGACGCAESRNLRLGGLRGGAHHSVAPARTETSQPRSRALLPLLYRMYVFGRSGFAGRAPKRRGPRSGAGGAAQRYLRAGRAGRELADSLPGVRVGAGASRLPAWWPTPPRAAEPAVVARS
eukprot:scaffold3551_cov408-Prasinococcus_capsulatus_cf.AAC.14